MGKLAVGPDTATATGGLHGTARQRQRTAAAMVLLGFRPSTATPGAGPVLGDLKEEEERRAALDAAWHVVSTHAGGVIAQRVGV